jgi:hypothetical protein
MTLFRSTEIFLFDRSARAVCQFLSSSGIGTTSSSSFDLKDQLAVAIDRLNVHHSLNSWLPNRKTAGVAPIAESAEAIETNGRLSRRGRGSPSASDGSPVVAEELAPPFRAARRRMPVHPYPLQRRVLLRNQRRNGSVRTPPQGRSGKRRRDRKKSHHRGGIDQNSDGDPLGPVDRN